MRPTTSILAMFTLVCVALLATACAPAETPAQNTGTPTTPSEPEPVREEPPAPPVVETGTLDPSAYDNLPKDVQDILAKGASQEAKGYGYLYREISGGSLASKDANNLRVKQRGDIRRATVTAEPKIQSAEYWVETIILDTDARTATAYCARRDCDGVPTPAPRTMPYADWSWVSPGEWLDGLRDVEKLGEETVADRAAYRLAAEWDDRPVTVWVDRFSGLPLQVIDGSTTYMYTEVKLGVSEADLKP